MASEGLLPYRDYPLFHLPNLVYIYAGAIRLTGDPILGPKLVSFVSTWLAAGLILVTSLRVFRGGTLGHVAVATSLLVLFVFDPLSLYTTGKTWNHEVPALLLMLAVLFHVESLRRDSSPLLLLSGAACGLAIGCRLTFLPCILPLLGLTFFFPQPLQRRLRLAGIFAAGALIALGPSIYFLATTPDAFLFGNLEFPRLRLLDPENTRIRKTMTIWRKVRFLVKEVIIPSWPVFVALAAVATPGIRRRIAAAEPASTGLTLVLWVAGFLVLGCFLPSRYQYQHFYSLIPLTILGLAMTGRTGGAHQRGAAIFPAGLAALAGASLFTAVAAPRKGNEAVVAWNLFSHPEEWFPSQAAAFGKEIREQVPIGRVLTLAPSWAIAGGVPIYPELATGPFGWRSAPFVAPERRRQFHVLGPDDLPSQLAAEPPAGILTGVEEDDLEAPLIAYAKSNGYTPIRLSRKRTLWRK